MKDHIIIWSADNDMKACLIVAVIIKDLKGLIMKPWNHDLSDIVAVL